MDESTLELVNFIKDELLDEEAEINLDTSLFKDQLLDSLSLSELIIFLEGKHSISIGPMDINYDNFDTVENILKFVERKRSS